MGCAENARLSLAWGRRFLRGVGLCALVEFTLLFEWDLLQSQRQAVLSEDDLCLQVATLFILELKVPAVAHRTDRERRLLCVRAADADARPAASLRLDRVLI